MARCSCQGTLPEECNCTLSSTSTVSVAGAGSDASPYTASPDLAAAPGLLSCGADGLLGEFPARVLSPPRAKVIRTTGQVVASATAVKIIFDQVRYDSDGFWDIANPTRLTNTLGQTALFSAGGIAALFLTGALQTDDWQIQLWQNNTRVEAKTRRIEGLSTVDNELTDCMCISEDLLLAAGDYVELVVFQNSVSSLLARPYQRLAPVMWLTYESD